MSVKERIKLLVKEAELYRSQSLLDQSKEKYLELLNLVVNHELTSKDNKLISSIKDRIRTVGDEINEIDQATESPELSEDVQGLISKLFSFSKNQEVLGLHGKIGIR